MPASRRNTPHTLLLTALIAAATLGLAAPTAQAQAQPPNEADLETLESELQERRLRTQKLDQEALSLRREEEELQKRLVDAAETVQTAEDRLSDIERRIVGMLAQQSLLVRQLLEREEAMGDLLAALQALEMNRPPALAIEPDDAVKAARTAMLLSSLIPELQAEADALSDDLTKLAALRSDIESQREEEIDATEKLAEERVALEALLAELSEKRQSKVSQAEQERREIAALAAEARDLRTLLQRLSRQRASLIPRQKPPTSVPDAADDEQRALPPLQEAYASAAIRRFAQAKGTLKQPVSGFVRQSFGESEDTGTPSKGVRYATRARAQVVAPFDGTIVFAGPFLGYGQLLIIEAGDGYHILLAGMDRIDGVVGQRLLAGEPVGVMGSGGVDGPASDALNLYVEFRKDGKPFNPVPWMAAREGKAKG